jgi:hypothetical protein
VAKYAVLTRVSCSGRSSCSSSSAKAGCATCLLSAPASLYGSLHACHSGCQQLSAL